MDNYLEVGKTLLISELNPGIFHHHIVNVVCLSVKNGIKIIISFHLCIEPFSYVQCLILTVAGVSSVNSDCVKNKQPLLKPVIAYCYVVVTSECGWQKYCLEEMLVVIILRQ